LANNGHVAPTAQTDRRMTSCKVFTFGQRCFVAITGSDNLEQNWTGCYSEAMVVNGESVDVPVAQYITLLFE